MGYNIDWIFPRLRHPSRFWHIASTLTVAAVGLFSKIIIVWLNKTRVYNRETLVEAVGKRKKGVPLITVSNHHSCFDDPGLWGVLPIKQICCKNSIRWSLTAHDICFTNKYHSLFFMFGKCIPVVRGAGVFQPAVDLCIQKLSLGDWVHVFPEGKVNSEKEYIRLKWGVGRMIYESPIIPIIIPIWHEGMDSVLPNEPPYVLKFGKKVTINIGKPIHLNDMIEGLKLKNTPEVEARKLITDKIQEEMKILRRETESLHEKC